MSDETRTEDEALLRELVEHHHAEDESDETDGTTYRFCVECDTTGPGDGEWQCQTRTLPDRLFAELSSVRAEADDLRDEHRTFADNLGFGDGVTEPCATLEQMTEPIMGWQSDAHEHAECPEWCDECDQWERPRSCDHCKGSGYGGPLIQSMDNIQGWTECEWCAGVGRAHVEYTLSGTSAAKAERDAARAELAEACRKLAEIERVALSWVDSRRESFSAVELDCAQEILAAVGSGDTEPATETAMYDLRCPNCGASASLPLGMTCSDHRPVRYPAAPAVGDTKDEQR